MSRLHTLASSLLVATTFATAAQAAEPLDKSKIVQYRDLCVRTEVGAQSSLKKSYIALVQPPEHSATSRVEMPEEAVRRWYRVNEKMMKESSPANGAYWAFLKAQGHEFSTIINDIDKDRALKSGSQVRFCDPTV